MSKNDPRGAAFPAVAKTLAALVAAAFLSSCDAYVSASEHQASLQLADYSGSLRATASNNKESVFEIGTVKVGGLRHGEEATIPLDITGVHSATVFATCDRHCDDLDLRVVTDDGRLIAIDDEKDRIPRVEIPKGKSHNLFLKVRMANCSSMSCSYAVGQFQYKDYAGGTGSCFAVSPDGLLMTALHVVDHASSIMVTFSDGRKGDATVLRRSEDNDLALLRANVQTPIWLPLADSSEIAIGMPAFTVGYPLPSTLGSDVKLTEGTISALSGLGGEATLLQVSIPIQSGNSGSPVVSSAGRVLGIIQSSVEKDGTGSLMQLTNFARNVRVVSLLLPSGLTIPVVPSAATREHAIERALKAVCKVDVT